MHWMQQRDTCVFYVIRMSSTQRTLWTRDIQEKELSTWQAWPSISHPPLTLEQCVIPVSMGIDSDLFCCWPLQVFNFNYSILIAFKTIVFRFHCMGFSSTFLCTCIINIMGFFGVMIVRQDMLLCSTKALPASLCVFMPARPLGSSSPTVSTPRGIISGQSGTPDCRPPSLVRLALQISITIITFSHFLSDYSHTTLFSSSSSMEISLSSTPISLLVCFREQRTSHSMLQ